MISVLLAFTTFAISTMITLVMLVVAIVYCICPCFQNVKKLV